MEVLTLCILLGAFIAGSESLQEYYFVTGPNVIRFDHDETFVVSIFGDHHSVPVRVWFQHRDKQFSNRTVSVPSQKHTVNTTLRVSEVDIFDSVIDEKPRNIKLCSRRQNEGDICRDLVLSYNTGYLIVQTDKPIYTPLQKVKIRVLALDESLKAITSDKWQVAMDIVSPSNLTLGRKTFTVTKASGFYRNVFTLPPFPEIGMWTARAFYRGQFETVSRALFQVDEYVLPTYGVSVDVSVPYILEFEDQTIDITVKADYVYGKPVNGNARLTLNITNSMGDSEYLMEMTKKSLQNGIQEFSVTIGEILDSKPLKDKDFPEGSRLLVVATVFESATGKEEATFHDETIFASRPYIFKFTRSKRYFRPGMEYYVQVDMLTPNRQPAIGKVIQVVQLNENGQELERKPVTTNSRGEALAIFSALNTDTMRFKVIAPRSVQESEVLVVTAYDDKNQIQVERVITEDDIMLMRASTNIQLDSSGNAKSGYTGMLFMVVSRGKIVKTVFKPASNKVSEEISEELQEFINPTARLLVFYVDEGTRKVVADSIKFEVDPKCRGDGLTLDPERVQVVPGEGDKLKITGTPFMWVGLNAMDKALLLLNNENILKKNKMFDALTSHDLGCGEGSGRNNGDVFKNAGLTVLTDANVETEVNRLSEECDEAKKRRKRSADDCYGANKLCCEYGARYAKEVFSEAETKEDQAKIDPYTKCYSAAMSNPVEKTSARCLHAVLYSCIENLESWISAITHVSRALDDVSQYASDLELLAQNRIRPHKRTDFRESFLFEEVQLDSTGAEEKLYTYPDSITEWLIQGIGITENKGMCIADPVEVKVFRQFFIQLDLPYKATRLEMFDVKATLFNYGHSTKSKEANMYLEGVEGLCYGKDPGLPSDRKYVELKPNDARTVRFPMVPLKAGLFPITVTAIVTNLGIPEVDVIEKKLHVVNEGIPVIINIQVCLDPNEQREDCESHTRVNTHYGIATDKGTREQISHVDLTLPQEAIPGTGAATAYIQGDLMDNVVKKILSGVDSLFQCPHGCGEQTIATTAPNVYAMMYLKQTNQVTAEAEEIGNTNIRNGVNREKTMFRHSDGSYSCCNRDKHTGIYRPTSVWLTAFVAKVFCHADEVVDDAIDEVLDLHATINFLKNHINNQGQFIEIKDTRFGSWLKGSVEGGSPSLTSFVLISLLECGIMKGQLNRTVDLATNYIENLDEGWLKSRPFDLAISTYALSLSNSAKKGDFKKWLDSIQRKNGKNIYWAKTDIPANTQADAYSVETTAYALLAMLQFNDLKTSAFIVRWLTSQQDAHGVFRSTQDTVVGLQALSQYSIRTYSPEVDLQVSMYADRWKGTELPVKNEKFKLQQIVDKLPVEKGDNEMTVKVTGTTGSGRMRIELRYNRPAKSDEICPFELSDIDVGEVSNDDMDKNIAKKRQCDVCGKCALDPAIPDYDSLTTTEPNKSDFGRRKRQTGGNDGQNKKCIRFTVRAKEGHEHGMSMIYFNLETDVTVLEEDMKRLVLENENLDDYEMPTNGNGFIVFYLNTLNSSHWNNFVFRLVDNFEGDVNTRQPVSVDVFDYYNPEQYCRKIYGTGPNRDAPVDFACDSNNQQCKCRQSTCSQSVGNEIIEMLSSGKKPALKLLRYTCSAEKANYAVLVEVTDVWEDTDNKKNTMAMGVVLESIHQGAVEQEKDDEMTFYWKTSCPHPKLEKGKEYYIVAKDGHKVATVDNQSEYHYPLMGTALVIENFKRKIRCPKPKKGRRRKKGPKERIADVMCNYKALLKRNGCRQ